MGEWGTMWRRYDDAVLAIHATPDTDEMRRDLMVRLPQMIPHDCSFFDRCSLVGGRLQFHSPVTFGMSNEATLAYYDRYASSDYAAWAFSADAPVVYRDTDLVPGSLRERSDIYQKWMAPLGVHFGMGTTVVANGTVFGSLTLFRAREAGDFTDEELEVLRRLNAHLIQRFSVEDADEASRPPRLAGRDQIKEHYLLTRREDEILQLMSEGLTNAEIADRLCISESTAKKHINSLYHKLGVRGRPHLMRLVYQLTSSSVG